MEALSLLELNALVRRSLEQCLPDEYWVQAELSDVPGIVIWNLFRKPPVAMVWLQRRGVLSGRMSIGC